MAGAFSVEVLGAALFDADSFELAERDFVAELLLPPLDRLAEPDLPVCGFPDPERRPLFAPVSPRSSNFSLARPSRVRAEPGSSPVVPAGIPNPM